MNIYLRGKVLVDSHTNDDIILRLIMELAQPLRNKKDWSIKYFMFYGKLIENYVAI